jgi:hypothetical protein
MKKRLAIFPGISHDVFYLNDEECFQVESIFLLENRGLQDIISHIMEREIRGNNESIQALPPFHNYKYSWCSAAGLHLLKRGKYTDDAVDHAQKVKTRNTDDSDKKDFLRCIECQYPITRKSDRIQINEKHQHVFANPHGYIFQIGCFAQAPGCVIAGEETSYFSWFPGYTWRFAHCGQCLTLLGWAFRSNESQFLGLILDKLQESA